MLPCVLWGARVCLERRLWEACRALHVAEALAWQHWGEGRESRLEAGGLLGGRGWNQKREAESKEPGAHGSAGGSNREGGGSTESREVANGAVL